MIVTSLEDTLVLVTQGDHAHLAAELLSLFRLPELVGHPRRERLIRATREHDNGWRELDAAPPVDRGSGRPLGFRGVPGALRREIWTRGSNRWRDNDPYVALLITTHAIELHHQHRGEDEWAPWLEALEDLRRDLITDTSLARDEIDADYAWLRLADTCSLALCERQTGYFDVGGLRGHVEMDVLRLTPFPLAGRTTFRLMSRSIPHRAYDGDRALGNTLAATRWERWSISVAPDDL